MRLARPPVVALAVALVAAGVGATRAGGLPAAAAAPERTAAPLEQRLAARLDQAAVRAGRFGGTVVDLDTGAVVFDRNGAAPLVPGSVAKVATTVAALDALGPGYRFETALFVRGSFDATTGVLDGDLVLRGSGDPGLSKRFHPDDPMWPWSRFAQAVAKAGVRRVTGSLVLDDGPFDRVFVHPSWSAGDLDDWYGAPVGGLSFNDGCVTVVVRGGRAAGVDATVAFPSTPGPWPFDLAVRTVDDRVAEVGGAFTPDARLRIFGRIGPGLDATFDAPVPNPLEFSGAAMARALATAGVAVDRGARVAASPADRAEGTPLDVVAQPLASALRVMDRRSQNLYASLLFKAAGAAREGLGSWASGERAVAASLARRGIAPAGLRVVDGSGLSTENRLSTAAVARLLASLDADLVGGPIARDALAVPGEEGTLQKRFRDVRERARLHAKTGTLGRNGVHALAGYVDGRAGRRGLAFAFFVNDGKVDGRDLGDDLARILLDE